MSTLQLFLNRYDGSPVASQIRASRLKKVGDQIVIELPFGEGEDFEILFETDNAPVDEALLAQARSLMSCIGELDNKVQESCAEECNRKGIHPRNFESMLAYVRLRPNAAKLHYFGTGVNTEWDELVELTNEAWRYIGTAGKVSPPHNA